MSAAQIDAPQKRIIPVHFPAGEVATIDEAEKTLGAQGYPLNFILREAVRKGLPWVVKNYKDRAAESSFTHKVRLVIDEFADDAEITTELVTQALTEKYKSLDKAEYDRLCESVNNVSKVLERLTDDGVLIVQKTEGRKKVWRKPKLKNKRKRQPALTG